MRELRVIHGEWDEFTHPKFGLLVIHRHNRKKTTRESDESSPLKTRNSSTSKSPQGKREIAKSSENRLRLLTHVTLQPV